MMVKYKHEQSQPEPASTVVGGHAYCMERETVTKWSTDGLRNGWCHAASSYKCPGPHVPMTFKEPF